MENVSLALVDSNSARRASAVHALGESGLHIEPYEDVWEFTARMTGRRIVLVHDQDRKVQDILRWAALTNSSVGVLAYSEAPPLGSVVEALRAGAFDYIDWPAQPDRIRQAIDLCIDIKLPEWEKIERKSAALRLIQSLTPREQQVLEEMAKGLSSRAIGGHLGISPRTVEIHRAHMLGKIRASNSIDAARIAFEAGMQMEPVRLNL